jgi:hypothetical protein
MITRKVVPTRLVALAVLVTVSIFCGCGGGSGGGGDGRSFGDQLGSLFFSSLGPKAHGLVVPEEPFDLTLTEFESGQDYVVRESTLVIRGELTPNTDEEVVEGAVLPLVRWINRETGEEGLGETSDENPSILPPQAGGIGFRCEVPLIPGVNSVTVSAEWMGESASIEISVTCEHLEEAPGQQAGFADDDGSWSGE